MDEVTRRHALQLAAGLGLATALGEPSPASADDAKDKKPAQTDRDRVLAVGMTPEEADCWELTEVFRRNPLVKLCLSGHMHTCDRVEYRGVWYVCGGAVSGAWWGGSEYGFPPWRRLGSDRRTRLGLRSARAARGQYHARPSS